MNKRKILIVLGLITGLGGLIYMIKRKSGNDSEDLGDIE